MTTYQLPLPELSGTYAERTAYPTGQLVPGQVWVQTDSGQSGGITFPQEPYYWPSSISIWIYDPNSIGGGIDLDGRGRDTGAGGYFRNNNINNQSTLIMANPDGGNAYFGLWQRLVGGVGATVGLFIQQITYRATLRTALGQILGLWSTDMTNGQNKRMLDLRISTRHEASLRFGSSATDNNFGQIPAHYGIDLSESSNSGASETSISKPSIPAYALAGSGQAVEIFCWGIAASNANAKRARLAIGASTIIGNTLSLAANGNRWEMRVVVYRTGPNSQKFIGCNKFIGLTENGTDGTASETESADIPVTVGLTGAQSNDITVKGFQMMFYN